MKDIAEVIAAWSVIAWGGFVSVCGFLEKINACLSFVIAIMTIIALYYRIRKDSSSVKEDKTE